MILSNLDIIKAMQKGELQIKPFDKTMLRAAGIDLAVGSTIYKQIEGSTVDPYRQETMNCFRCVELTEEEPFVFKSGDFILTETLEKIGISTKLSAIVDGRSTLARLGISVIQGASVIDTGHGWPNPRPIVLELKNNGLNPVLLYPKMKIAKLIFVKLKSEAKFGYDDAGKYATGEVIPKVLTESYHRLAIRHIAISHQ